MSEPEKPLDSAERAPAPAAQPPSDEERLRAVVRDEYRRIEAEKRNAERNGIIEGAAIAAVIAGAGFLLSTGIKSFFRPKDQ